MPHQVTHAKIWAYLDAESETYDKWLEAHGERHSDDYGLTETDFIAIKNADLKSIINGKDMSTDHLSGDDIIHAVAQVLEAQKEGYTITCWYGNQAEALVVGYRPDQITIEEEPA